MCKVIIYLEYIFLILYSKENSNTQDAKKNSSEAIFEPRIFGFDTSIRREKIARGLIALHRKLDSNNIMGYYIDRWSQTGENIVILEGFDNKHLKYLHDEVKYVALDTHVFHRRWSSGRDILVLTVFGQQDDLEDFFEGLIPLRNAPSRNVAYREIK
ncbi:hypothetical protein KPH14_005137 [Odynerus spinipes]|uniref:Uncharacterized protein n=1 Tax=Odynerus spinipes TaxID=1348599 RepID=A0AAD9RL56_9HYME|nr:hypothetical protein KPH14_005137 [Odynerus spinipes]